uniref:Uncharacterized protein n=1 Tax=Aegilops tauschii subsp. strangulata TaxID=200361 RepID=A0A452YD06_AEGTS
MRRTAYSAPTQQCDGFIGRCVLNIHLFYIGGRGSELCHNHKKFKKFAQASLQLCKSYMEMSSTTGTKRELLLAEMHLKSSLKEAMDFVDSEEYKQLADCLVELKDLIGAA